MASKSFTLDKQLLKSFEPLSDLTTDKLDELVEKSIIEDLPAGRVLFRQGEKDNRKLYLVSGQVELTDAVKGKSKTVKAKSSGSRQPLADKLPRPATAKTKGAVTLLTVDADLLEIIMDDSPPGMYDVEVTELDADDTTDWMLRFLQSPAFLKLPTDSIQAILMRMQEMPVNKGDVIIQQGKEDDYYYIIQSGSCAVMRRPAPKTEAVQIATLSEGDGFGEEALITTGKRNATIKMLSQGTLMRLKKQDFLEFLAKPLIPEVNESEALQKISAGSLLIDVRRHGEFNKQHVEGSVNIPLSMLRMKTKGLDPNREYVLVCDDGSRSAAAAFLMTQQGLNVSVLSDGLCETSYKLLANSSSAPLKAVPDTRRTVAAEKSKKAAEARAQKISQQASSAKAEAEKLAKQTAAAEAASRDAAAKVQRLQKEQNKQQSGSKVSKTNARHEQARAIKAAEQKAVQMKQQAEVARKQAEEQLKKIQSAQQANQQKQKLLDDSLDRAKEIAAESAKAAADARRQAEKEAGQIRQKAMAEAEKLKVEMEAARLKLERDARRKQDEQQAQRDMAIKSAREAESVARQVAEQAQREAEAIRREALQEAEEIKAEMQATRLQAKQQAERAAEKERQFAAKQAADEAEQIRLLAIYEAEELRSEMKNTRKVIEEQAANQSRAEEEARARQEREQQAQRDAQRDAENRERLRKAAEAQVKRDAEEQARKEREAEQRALQQAEEAQREQRRLQANKNAQMKKKDQARRMAEDIKAKMERAEQARQQEEFAPQTAGLSVANATIKRSKGKIILENDEDVFIFKEPTVTVAEVQNEIRQLDNFEEMKDELPSFEVDEPEKPVFAPINTQAVSLKLEQQASNHKQKRKKHQLIALAASVVIALGGATSYLLMNPAMLEGITIAKFSSATGNAKASLHNSSANSKLNKAAKKAKEKKLKQDASSRFSRLMNEWKDLVGSNN